MVRIGPEDKSWTGRDPFDPDVVLRGGTSILNYAKAAARGVWNYGEKK
jgi:hypothetical protein